MTASEPARLGSLRVALLWVVAASCLGIGTELILIGHYDNIYQWLPLSLLPLGLVASLLFWMSPRLAALRAFRLVMLLFLLSGLAGVFLHGKGNREFELEMTPSIHGLELWREMATGATPLLAPGAMSQLGVLGLLCSLGARGKDRA